jgi:hypothetical protein
MALLGSFRVSHKNITFERGPEEQVAAGRLYFFGLRGTADECDSQPPKRIVLRLYFAGRQQLTFEKNNQDESRLCPLRLMSALDFSKLPRFPL